MLQSGARVASLTAIVLFALVAVYPSISILRVDGREAANPEAKDADIKEL